ncbi:general secretion pathway protein L [Acetobacter orleanensis JCM 7639]|nr:general secretion pathway protein L [Acetobacter orleanensis JCM 7639]
MLRKAAARWLPARLKTVFNGIQSRYATPTVVIHPGTQSLTLLPQSPDTPPHVVPATPDGMAQLATLCASRKPLQRLPLGRKRSPLGVRVIVPGLIILQRVVRLPTSAAADADSFVRYQMDRIVPFAPEEILWGLSPLSTDAPTDTEFLLGITPLLPLAPWLDAFKAAHLKPVALASQTDGSTPSLPLSDHEHSTRPSRTLVTVAALALGLTLGVPFIWQAVADYRLTTQLENLQPQRLVAETLRSRTEALTNSNTLLNHEAQRVGSPLTLLAKLTNALPDTTFLDSLSLKQGQITLEGQSKEAARLIGLLEKENAMRDPRFVGPLLRLPEGRGESFTLHGSVQN